MDEKLLNSYFDVKDVVMVDGRFAHWCKSCGSLVRVTSLDGHIAFHEQAGRGASAATYNNRYGS